jgi:hypothetical protein
MVLLVDWSTFDRASAVHVTLDVRWLFRRADRAVDGGPDWAVEAVRLDVVALLVGSLDLILSVVRHVNAPFARRPLPTH